ncbi:anti-sigma factor domain-containing protein [Desulfitobacterium sp.]|uniref:anti-sigma factor domain-containing protein n=1 Tax=Desulfitobacterium sp. TaxID=49981 RepID=UPI002B21B5F6|nr:anti-sigma factor domain-containing protein [Desulfitobacterium sp.]MEA4902702.1 anti-sigma factor domain-containing protein [Desulfitobacterium sp.]
MKAVVLEKKDTMVTILAADGSFQKIRYRKPVGVGSEIELAKIHQHRPNWRVITSVAAILIFTLIGSMSWSFYQATTAVAMISVDINPRLQLTLNQKGEIIQFEALNSDAEDVVKGLELKGKSWDQALENIIEQSVTLNYLNSDHNWVLVGYSPLKEGKEVPKGVTSDDIAQSIESAAQAEKVNPNFAVYQLGADEQTQAKKQGLTLGEYALINTAKNAGIQAENSTVKSTDERVNLLEQPQVQEELTKKNNGVSIHKGSLGEGSKAESGIKGNSKQIKGNSNGIQSKDRSKNNAQDNKQWGKEQRKLEEIKDGNPDKQGERGSQGNQDEQGERRSQGSRVEQGNQGEQGNQDEQGNQNEQGNQGK